jgi:hypothetical protein
MNSKENAYQPDSENSKFGVFMKMNFRTDGSHYADMKAHGWTFDGDGEKAYGKCFTDEKDREEARASWEAVPPAQPGDVWRLVWGGVGNEDKLAGYSICCPGCGHVHAWVRASNCHDGEIEIVDKYSDADGIHEYKYKQCVHQREHRSCWTWTGSPEDGTLTGAPSLLVQQDDCKWHGFIQNGDIHT